MNDYRWTVRAAVVALVLRIFGVVFADMQPEA